MADSLDFLTVKILHILEIFLASPGVEVFAKFFKRGLFNEPGRPNFSPKGPSGDGACGGLILIAP